MQKVLIKNVWFRLTVMLVNLIDLIRFIALFCMENSLFPQLSFGVLQGFSEKEIFNGRFDFYVKLN